MSVADLLGMGPKRTLVENADGSSTLTVTPPEFLGYRGATIKLNADQTRRYKKNYIEGKELAQKVFPDLSPSQREIIMSGINQDEWDEVTKEEENYDELMGAEHHI